MNNSDFRSLLLPSAATKSTAGTPPAKAPTTSSLGSRKSAFVPRNVRPSTKPVYYKPPTISDGTEANGRPKKKAKTLNLGAGYTNRALERLGNNSDEIRDEKERRIHELALRARDGEIEEEEFERLRDQIASGDVASTHLVRGLDRKLLDRVKRGEDVMTGQQASTPFASEGEEADEELDEIGEKEVQTRQRDKVEKRGELNQSAALETPMVGVKKSRNDILAELKAQRAKESQARLEARPELGDKFKAIQPRKDKPKTVIDSKGREVIIIKDEHGNIKKKVRKAAPEAPKADMKPTKFLDHGVHVPKPEDPPTTAAEEEEEMGKMFDDVEDDYNPLQGLDDEHGSSSSSDSESEDGEIAEGGPSPHDKKSDATPGGNASPGQQAPKAKARNYFSTTQSDADAAAAETDKASANNPFQDPAFVSAITRASDMAKLKIHLSSSSSSSSRDPPAIGQDSGVARQDEHGEDEDEEATLARLEKEARLKKKQQALVASLGRDDEDLDMGFGGGRFDDDDDGDDDGKVKLSEWGKAAGDDGKKGQKKGGERKKRSRGKRKGDKDSAEDVLDVMRRRKQG